MSGFNQSAWAYVLYIKINDPQCQRLIEKFHIPQRGAHISVQDVDLLIEETEGGKEVLFIQHPWFRLGLPILIETLTNSKFFGFKDVMRELTLYHKYLDNYHAAVNERKKLPGFGRVAPPPPPRQQLPLPPPTTQPRPPLVLKSKQKQAAENEVDMPPANDDVKQPTKPEPFDFKKLVQTDTGAALADSGPRLSEWVKQHDPGLPSQQPDDQTYVDENGHPLTAEEVAQMKANGAEEVDSTAGLRTSYEGRSPPQPPPQPPPPKAVPRSVLPAPAPPPRKAPRGTSFT